MSIRSTTRLTRLLLFGSGFVFMILNMTAAEDSKHLDSISDEDDIHANEKRYVAALAKSGRLPQFHSNEKKSGNDASYDESLSRSSDAQDLSWAESKRHIGAFLNRNPEFSGFAGSPGEIERRAMYVGLDAEPSSLGNVDKRNVAALARLGGLNAIRYSQFQPQLSGKRWAPPMVMMNDGIPPSSDADDDEEEDCTGSQDSDGVNSEDNYLYPNLIPSQQKRYVAALAGSGRLPIWHPQRMWSGGKRAPRYWIRYRTGFRQFGNNAGKRQDSMNDIPKNRRCKKSVNTPEKRNLSVLARKGVLSSLPYNSA